MAPLQRAIVTVAVVPKDPCDSFSVFYFYSRPYFALSPRFILGLLIKLSRLLLVFRRAHRQYGLGQDKKSQPESDFAKRRVSPTTDDRQPTFSPFLASRLFATCCTRINSRSGTCRYPGVISRYRHIRHYPILRQSEYSEQWLEFALLLRKNALRAEFSRGSSYRWVGRVRTRRRSLSVASSVAPNEKFL